LPKIRIIARLDIKNEYVIKGIHLEGLRKIGNPNLLAKKYYDDGRISIPYYTLKLYTTYSLDNTDNNSLPNGITENDFFNN